MPAEPDDQNDQVDEHDEGGEEAEDERDAAADHKYLLLLLFATRCRLPNIAVM